MPRLGSRRTDGGPRHADRAKLGLPPPLSTRAGEETPRGHHPPATVRGEEVGVGAALEGLGVHPSHRGSNVGVVILLPYVHMVTTYC